MKIKYLFLIALITCLTVLTSQKDAFALFTVPEDEIIENPDENTDLAEAYSEFTPSTLKIKDIIDTQIFLKDENASCAPRKIYTPKLNRNQHIPTKNAVLLKSSKKLSTAASFNILFGWILLISLLAGYAIIVRLRNTEGEEEY
ncbi:MAG: hypothetical protein KAI43_06735 [Candidatus Aureabacteria bacterium]|nr:hypothetical protein [Candidatus Auribacterota bacterium]